MLQRSRWKLAPAQTGCAASWARAPTVSPHKTARPQQAPTQAVNLLCTEERSGVGERCAAIVQCEASAESQWERIVFRPAVNAEATKLAKRFASRFDVHLLSTQDPQWCVLVRRAVRGRHLALALAYHEGLRDRELAENI